MIRESRVEIGESTAIRISPGPEFPKMAIIIKITGKIKITMVEIT